MLEFGVVVCIVEGGVEYIKVINVDDFFFVLDIFCKVGYIIVIILSYKGVSLVKVELLVKMVLVLG